VTLEMDPRNRSTDRVTRERLRLELLRSLRPTAFVSLCAVLAIVCVGLAVTQMSPIGFSSTRTYRLQLKDATAIRSGIHAVRFRGVDVGTIQKLTLGDGSPVATIEVNGDAGPLYRDMQAQLRPETALQDMYIDIMERGTPAAGRLRSDDVVPADQTAMPVNIDDVLNTLRPGVRMHLRTVLAQLGRGLDSRGDELEQVLITATPLIRSAGQISDALSDHATLVRELVHHSRQLTVELGTRESLLRSFVDRSAAVLSTVGARRNDLGAMLHRLPPVLTGVTGSLTAVGGVLDDTDRAIAALQPVARELGPALSAITDLSDTAGPAVRALRPAVTDLTPLARELPGLADNLRGAVDALQPQAPSLGRVVRIADKCEAGIHGFFQWNVSISKLGDRRGAIPRGNLVLGGQSTSLLNDPQEFAPQACSGGRPIGGRVPQLKDKF
jgi:virulence factor Mce-like protein